jgi:hypothetical protein
MGVNAMMNHGNGLTVMACSYNEMIMHFIFTSGPHPAGALDSCM